MAKPTRLTDDQIIKYLEEGWWENKTISQTADENADKYALNGAVSDSKGASLTWKELKNASDKLAAKLMTIGCEKDAVILMQLPNTVENIIARIALEKSGIIVLSVPMTYQKAELEKAIQKSGAVAIITTKAGKKGTFETAQELKIIVKHLIVIEDLLASIDYETTCSQNKIDLIEDRRLCCSDINFIALTSGSTGDAKLCEWPGAPMALMGRNVSEKMAITEKDVVGILAPLTGGPGLVMWLAAIWAAAKTALLEFFDPEKSLAFLENQRVTVAGAVPTQLLKILNHPGLQHYNLSCFKAIRCGGAGISPSKAMEVEKALGCKIVPVSGSMETITYTHAAIDDLANIRHRTVGKMTPGNEIKVVNAEGKVVGPGERGVMYVRGACTGSGYFQDERSTIEAWGALGEAGWFCSGDIVETDVEGNVTIVGREKDTIIRGGQNIYPKEIENLLETHPNVLECVVVGIPDEIMGERACACIVPKPGSNINFEEIVSYLKERNIAKFKLPEKMKLLDKLPTVTDGQKINKKLLYQELRQEVKG